MSRWRNEHLGSLVSLEYGSALHADSRTGQGFPVYGSNGVVGSHDTALVAGPGIIVGRKGSVGAIKWSQADFWPIDTAYWVKPRVNLDLRWMYAVLSRLGLDALDSSTGVPGLNRNDAYECPVLMPPLDEQRRIAEILDTTDETIQVSERLVEKLAVLYEGLRERVCSSAAANAELTRLSENIVHLIDCPHSTPAYQPYGILVARTTNIRNGRFLKETASHVSEADYRDRISRMKPRAGDVILTREAPVGEAFAIPRDMRICLGQRVVLIRTSPQLLGRYLVELIYSSEGVRQIQRLTAGTTNPHLNVDDIPNLVFRIPSLSVQREAIQVLDEITTSMDIEVERLGKLSQIQRCLASDLLSGAVRTTSS